MILLTYKLIGMKNKKLTCNNLSNCVNLRVKFKEHLLLCGVLYFMLAVGSGSTATTSGDANGTTSKTKEITTYKLNDDIYVTNSHGKYRIKFTGVSETDDRNSFSDKQADRVILVEYAKKLSI